MDEVYMLAEGRRGKAATWETSRADELGSADLAAWIHARDLICQVDEPRSHRFYPYALRNAFSRLETFSFGAWDDGRWDKYDRQHTARYHAHGAAERSIQESTCPDLDISRVLAMVFQGSRPFKACHDTRARVSIDIYSSIVSSRPAFTIIHNAQLQNLFVRDHVRIYVSTQVFKKRFIREQFVVGNLCLDYGDRTKPVFRPHHPHEFPDHPDSVELAGLLRRIRAIDPAEETAQLMRKNLEICLVPETEGDSEELQIARDVRDALATYEEASQKRDGTQGYLGRLKIFVGDDVPACPCCGKKR